MPSGLFTADLTLTTAVVSRGDFGGIADMIFPAFPTEKKISKIARMDAAGEISRFMDDVRAPGAAAKTVDFSVTRPVQFECKDHAIAAKVAVEDFNSEIMVFRDMSTYARAVAKVSSIAREKRIFDLLTATLTGLATSTPAVGAKFNEPGGSPVSFIMSVLGSTGTRSGKRPTFIAMAAPTLDVITQNAQFIEQFKGVDRNDRAQAGERLRGIFGVQAVYIAESATYNTAAVGATATFAEIWGDNILVGFQEPVSGLTSNPFITPTWNPAQPDLSPTGEGGLVAGGWRIESWFDNMFKSFWVRVSRYIDETVMFAAGDPEIPAHLITNTRSDV